MQLKVEQELEKGKIYAITGTDESVNFDHLTDVAQRVGCGFLVVREGQKIEEFKDTAIKMTAVALLDEIEASQLPLSDVIELIRDRYKE